MSHLMTPPLALSLALTLIAPTGVQAAPPNPAGPAPVEGAISTDTPEAIAALIRAGHPEDALAACEHLLNTHLDPDQVPELRRLQGKALIALARFDEATTLLQAAADAHPLSAPLLHYETAVAAALSDDMDRAFTTLDAARDAGFVAFEYMDRDPRLNRLREDPRWHAWKENRDGTEALDGATLASNHGRAAISYVFCGDDAVMYVGYPISIAGTAVRKDGGLFLRPERLCGYDLSRIKEFVIPPEGDTQTLPWLCMASPDDMPDWRLMSETQLTSTFTLYRANPNSEDHIAGRSKRLHLSPNHPPLPKPYNACADYANIMKGPLTDEVPPMWDHILAEIPGRRDQKKP